LIAEPFAVPAADALDLSEALTARIGDEIDANNGWISFERYMQMALHEPGLGYYSAGAVKLGPGGDFTTAPELSDWLAAALAPFLCDALGAAESTLLVELGAGTGKLAGQLLEQLAARGVRDIAYAILETSADLRARQQTHLEALEKTGLAGSGFDVRWLEALPSPGTDCVVVANEVADVIPVVRFVKSGVTVLPLGIAREGGRFAVVPGDADPSLTDAVERIETDIGRTLPDGYCSEVRRLLRPWLAGVLDSIVRGGLLLIDYGMPRRDYFRPERSDGTLICHYRHHAHADPLLWPGLQDITAWVDFSEVATIARDVGFEVAGFTTQAQFLLESIARDRELAARQPSPEEASAMKTLILPGEMGERFKLIWLTNRITGPALPGRDFRNWL
jgi:SAM-dependent MidA family methyltransferase